MRRLSFVVVLGLVTVAGSGCSCSEPSLIDATVPFLDSGLDASNTDGGDVDGGDVDGGRMGRDGGVSGCSTEEICDDGLDADCDGLVDEGCGCVPGDTASCFLDDPSFRGVGACTDGRMLCSGDFEFGEWGPCEGSVGPTAEVCDAAGIDEDCDGAPNDGCGCSDGDPDLPCGRDEGECAAGVQRCVGGMRTDCEGAIGPAIEACDGLDNDCDGNIDEFLARGCGVAVGVCRRGTETCTAGVWGECAGAVAPIDELCDMLDNDCDGMVDEEVRRTCGSDIGACVAGTETCTDGVFGACTGRVDAVAETCNGMDDDCDSMTDEGLVRGCGTDVGLCVAGTETCSAGSWGVCAGSTPPGPELCDGTNDENCDGAVDEGCDCITGRMRGCGTDVGRCVAGSQTCNASGMWGACMGATDPRTETCDGTDDDCDGMTDEGCDCITGSTRACGSSVGECRQGTETCDAMGHWGPCLGSRGPTTEVCNMRDDNCNMMVDEGGVCPRFPPVPVCPSMQSTVVGTAVSLAGSGSDPDGGTVTYSWTVSVRPIGSTAAPIPANAANTSFTPDAAGSYTLQMCVTDDEGERACCTVRVEATASCTVPAPPTGVTTCPTSWDRRPLVEFSPVPMGLVYRLSIDGMPSYGTATEGHNYHRPASVLPGGGAPPGTSSTIAVQACRATDPTCCSTGVAVNVRMVQACTTIIPADGTNIVFSEYLINGLGTPCPGAGCENGEAIEITNLSNCPVSLDGLHFEYCNASCSAGSVRWRDFTSADVIPPRGVYVAVRNPLASMCSFPLLGSDPSIFGRRVVTLDMQGSSLSSGWFNNDGGTLRLATGDWTGMLGDGTSISVVNYPDESSAPMCSSIGINAVDQCGNIGAGAARLDPHQLGRLWRPCDAVTSPNPPVCN